MSTLAGVGVQLLTAGDRLETQLNATGTWTVVVEDNGLDDTGSYALSFLNVTAGPFTSAGDANGDGRVTGGDAALVSRVSGNTDTVAGTTQVAGHRIEHDVAAGMAQVAVVIDRDAADVNAGFAFLDWSEDFLGSGQ